LVLTVRITVAQICKSARFQSCEKYAFKALVDIVFCYLCDLGKATHYFAGLGGRTRYNAFAMAKIGDIMNFRSKNTSSESPPLSALPSKPRLWSSHSQCLMIIAPLLERGGILLKKLTLKVTYKF